MKLKAIIASALLAAMATPAVFGSDAPVKREMRSAWVATVWRLDWPQNVISSTGNTAQIDRQKNDLITMLDSMSLNNMNAVNFQVRARCDAFYKSSYEPWSSDLVATRGLDPGYDPLQFCIEECHKRGMECHAWLNPYRYESVANQWDGSPQNYRDEHPEWLMDVASNDGTASILNPGLPEVRQRIYDVIDEIVRNYDVDGVLFDDYFYLSGTPTSMDADLYNAYKAEGGKLSQADWRRENVNIMIDGVYKTIKAAKPWVRFGVSPAGIACTSSAVANKYGISPCPTGSDWQYSSIYSDPIAWISRQSLDFISPQIYWTIGAGTDYDRAAKWWSDVAAKWNRHFYSSHSISSLTGSSKSPAMSGVEEQVKAYASGQNSTTFAEYADEIRLNRQYNHDDAPGSIFYSVKYMYRTAPLFAHYLKTQVFNTPALVPPMTWFAVSSPGNVSSVQRSGDKLTWKGIDNVRYTVYAVPTSVPEKNFNREVEYMLGVSYTEGYTIPQSKLSGYNYAICVLDRYGNEYSPVFVGSATRDLPAPALVSPGEAEVIEMPFDFEWQSINDATNYIVEVASDAQMSELLYTVPVEASTMSSDRLIGLPIDTPLYWRVRACGNSYNDGVSAVRSFTARNLQIISPANEATEVSLTPEIKWSFGERDITLQISMAEDFADKSIILESEAKGGVYTVPRYRLSAYTTYYVRALYVRNGQDCVSPVINFTTLGMTPDVPGIAYPVANGILHGNEHITVSPTDGLRSVRIEVSAATNFPARSSYVQSTVDPLTWADLKSGSEIKLSSKALADGTTYYVRVRGAYPAEDGTLNTEFCEPIAFLYSAKDGGVNDIVGDNADVVSSEYFDLAGRNLGAACPTESGTYICRQILDNGAVRVVKVIL